MANPTSLAQYEKTRNKKGARPILLFVVLLLVLILGGSVYGITTLMQNSYYTYHTEDYQGATYYIIDGDYRGDYDLQYFNLTEEELSSYSYATPLGATATTYQAGDETDACAEYTEEVERTLCEDTSANEESAAVAEEPTVTEESAATDEYTDKIYALDVAKIYDYQAYRSYCEEWGFEQRFTDETKQYAILSYMAHGSTDISVRLSHISIENNAITLYIWDKTEGNDENSAAAYLLVVPFEGKAVTDITTVPLHTQAELDKLKADQNSEGTAPSDEYSEESL